MMKEKYSLNQVFLIVFTVVSALGGAGWILFTSGSFLPDAELNREASSYKFMYQKSADLEKFRQIRNQELEAEISDLELEYSKLKMQKEFQIAFINMVSQIVTACINVTTAGEKQSKTDFNTTPAAIENSQSGAMVLKNCMETFSENEKISNAIK